MEKPEFMMLIFIDKELVPTTVGVPDKKLNGGSCKWRV